jgi:tRNA threonylcarbamoyladenosine biosynthesis protein TsaB
VLWVEGWGCAGFGESGRKRVFLFATFQGRNGKGRARGYALGVDALREDLRLLLIDTCGETAGVAVCAGAVVLAAEDLSRVGASAEIVGVVRRLLEGVGWRVGGLDAVGVVRGPGSFTGMRTGLAAAKGLCEAAGVRLAAVSRLEVLAEAAGVSEGLVALDAGRGEVYVREVASGREWVCGDAEVLGLGCSVVVAEARVAERLAGGDVVMRGLHVGDALGVVLRRVAEGGDDAEAVDANYVRGGREIYRETAKVVGGS